LLIFRISPPLFPVVQIYENYCSETVEFTIPFEHICFRAHLNSIRKSGKAFESYQQSGKKWGKVY
jgi:hypothetical protein